MSRSALVAEFVVQGARRYDQRSARRWLMSHVVQYRGLLVVFGCSTVLSSVASASIPVWTGRAFDAVAAGQVAPLVGIAGAMVGIALLQGGTQAASSWLVELVGRRLERDVRDELYVSLLGKSQTFHNRQRVGDIMARASNDVGQLSPILNPGLSLISRSLLALVVPIVFIALIDLRLLVAPLLFTVAFAFALRLYMRQLGPVSHALRGQFGTMNASLAETVAGIEVVKALVAEQHERARFLGHATAVRDLFVKVGKAQAVYLPTLFAGLAIAGGFAHGLYLLAVDALSLGDLVAFMGLMSALRLPAFISIFTFWLVQIGIAAAGRVLQLIQTETELDENATGHGAVLTGEVEFDAVDFGYDGADGKQVLRGLSFRVPAGTTVAIVGQTGSGKSTLTKLLNRTYDVSGGSIRLDGVDVRSWNLQELRPQISVIEQDVFLFSRSIADNISFGLGEVATPEAIERAARDAQAHDFITGFSEGYGTVIGERGVTLSGGQRQRLAIARALMTDPRILVIDDGTSAIDSATEDAIQRAIAAVLQGRTTFLITHRLSQIRRADWILVLDRGALVDQGTFADLIQSSPMLRRIFAQHDAGA